jgi:hypothetical protein
MAEENNMRVQSSTVDINKGLKGGFDLQSGQWEINQNIDQYRDAAKLDRDREAYFGRTNKGYRKMATIPDIVAIKINQDHGLDIHDTEFMQDKDKLKKLKSILIYEYPDLLVNK